MNRVFAALQEIDGLRSLMDECSQDKDMIDMANNELGQAIDEERRLHASLLKSLLPKDDADERDCILEVRAGIIVRPLPETPVDAHTNNIFHSIACVFCFFCLTKDFLRNWWGGGFFICNGHIQNVS